MAKHSIYHIITIWFLLTQTLSPFNILFPFNPSVHYAVFDVATIILFPDLLTRRSILALVVYTIVAYFFHLSGNAFFDTIATVVVPFLMMLSGLLIAEYALKYDRKYQFTRIVIYVVVIANLFMIMISIPQVMVTPNIIRPSVQEFVFGVREQYWIIKYSTCHGLAYLFAPLIFLCRRSFRKNKVFFLFWVLVSLFLFFIVFLSNATMPLLISMLMIVLGLIYNNERFTTKSIRGLIITVLLSVFLFQPSVSIPIINTMQSMMDKNSNNYRKMEEMKYSIIHEDSEGDMERREELYNTSTKLFIESPITGTSTPQLISRHSWFVDRLACFGLLCFIPVIFLFVFHIKDTYRQFRHTKVVYSIGVIGFLLMLFMKNEFGAGSWLYGFALLPLLCRYIDYSIEQKFIKKI